MSDAIPVTEGTDYALVHLDMGVLPLTRATAARELVDAFTRAAVHLERLEAARLDARAARALNMVTPVGPFGTSSPAVTVVRHVDVTGPCGCSCASVCGACKPGIGTPPLDAA